MELLTIIVNSGYSKRWELSGSWEHKIGFFCVVMKFDGIPGGHSDTHWEGEEWDSHS